MPRSSHPVLTHRTACTFLLAPPQPAAIQSSARSWQPENKRAPQTKAARACTLHSNMCVCVSAYAVPSGKTSPSLCLNSSSECSLWAPRGQKTLKGLIFKDLLRAVHNLVGTVSPTTDSILSLSCGAGREPASQGKQRGHWSAALPQSPETQASLWLNSPGRSHTPLCPSV